MDPGRDPLSNLSPSDFVIAKIVNRIRVLFFRREQKQGLICETRRQENFKECSQLFEISKFVTLAR